MSVASRVCIVSVLAARRDRARRSIMGNALVVRLVSVPIAELFADREILDTLATLGSIEPLERPWTFYDAADGDAARARRALLDVLPFGSIDPQGEDVDLQAPYPSPAPPPAAGGGRGRSTAGKPVVL